MPRTFLALGVITALAAAAAMFFMGGGGLSVYPMRIVGNSSSGYKILDGDKPFDQTFHVAFDGEIRWDFTNNTDPHETVQFTLGGDDFDPLNCPVNWSQCKYEWPTLVWGDTKEVSATPQKDPDSYTFSLYLGKSQGQLHKVDPELQIDANFRNLIALILALLSAISLARHGGLVEHRVNGNETITPTAAVLWVEAVGPPLPAFNTAPKTL